MSRSQHTTRRDLPWIHLPSIITTWITFVCDYWKKQTEEMKILKMTELRSKVNSIKISYA